MSKYLYYRQNGVRHLNLFGEEDISSQFPSVVEKLNKITEMCSYSTIDFNFSATVKQGTKTYDECKKVEDPLDVNFSAMFPNVGLEIVNDFYYKYLVKESPSMLILYPARRHRYVSENCVKALSSTIKELGYVLTDSGAIEPSSYISHYTVELDINEPSQDVIEFIGNYQFIN